MVGELTDVIERLRSEPQTELLAHVKDWLSREGVAAQRDVRRSRGPRTLVAVLRATAIDPPTGGNRVSVGFGVLVTTDNGVAVKVAIAE